ncbi:MAG: hypothetical protein U9P10_13790 [Thermodesulfobacteriota bacterium]|nr:hypothetical protein [Thermodesulfobacteriota bacterium]
MEWPEFLSDPVFKHTDILFLPAAYRERYGLLAGDTLLVHAHGIPSQGCIFTAGWGDIKDKSRVTMCSEREKSLKELLIKMNELGIELTAEKFDFKLETKKADLIIVKALKLDDCLNMNEDIKNYQKKEMRSFVKYKRAVNYNMRYSYNNKIEFVFFSDQKWGIVNDDRLDRIEFLFTENPGTWKESIENNRAFLKEFSEKKGEIKKYKQNISDMIQQANKKIDKCQEIMKCKDSIIAGLKCSNRLKGVMNSSGYEIESFQEQLENANSDAKEEQYINSGEGKEMLSRLKKEIDTPPTEKSIFKYNASDINASIKNVKDKINICKTKTSNIDLIKLDNDLKGVQVQKELLKEELLETQNNTLKELTDSLSKIEEKSENTANELKEAIEELSEKSDDLNKQFLDKTKNIKENFNNLNRNLNSLAQNLSTSKDENIWAVWINQTNKIMEQLNAYDWMSTEPTDDIEKKADLLAWILTQLKENAEKIIKTYESPVEQDDGLF